MMYEKGENLREKEIKLRITETRNI
jgi:hypothetical protein